MAAAQAEPAMGGHGAGRQAGSETVGAGEAAALIGPYTAQLRPRRRPRGR